MDFRGKGHEIQAEITQRHQSVQRDRSREGGRITAVVLPGTRKFSPLPVPCNLNHFIRRGNKPRSERRSQCSIQGKKVGAAQAPARTHSAPSLASSPVSNTPVPKGNQMASQTRLKVSLIPQETP